MTSAFGRGRSRRPAFPNVLAYEAGPWIGVRDLVEPSSSQRNFGTGAQNMYPTSPELGGAYIGRPGFTRADISQQLGALGVRRCQLFDEFVKLDGTRYRIAIAGGKFYTYNWGTETFTEDSPSPLVISTTAKVFGVAFADQYVITDGINKPIAWDGANFTELTNSPVLYGRPWVYYAKLFGIKSTERSTIVWSEENDPTIGYEAGGYNNAWTLGQTDQDPLTAGVGFNEVMVVFRARSMTQILGAVSTDFQSSGTREGISETIGTTSPDSPVVVGRSLYWVDADGRPQRLILNAGIEDEPGIWESARSTLGNIASTAYDVISGRYHPTIDLVLFSVPGVGLTDPSYFIAFDGSSGRYVGVWTGFPATAFGFWTDADNQVRMVHGETDGIPYVHGVPGGTTYNDELAAGTAAIEHIFETSAFGYDVLLEKQWDRVDIGVIAATNITAAQVRIATPTGTSAPVALSFSSGVALWDVALWDVAVWSSNSIEQKGAVGTNATGRWCRVQISHQVLGETIGLIRCAVQAFGLGTYPRAP